MPALAEFVTTYGHLSFDHLPFDAPDSLTLTQIVYMPMEGLADGVGETTVAQLWAHLQSNYPDSFTDPFQRKRYALTGLCAQAARYQDVRIRDYVNDVNPAQETQFCAATFLLPDGSRYIAFRGTDLTIAGWKEDLNMSFRTVPAQEKAVAYVQHAAQGFSDMLVLGGHSKGGHLALYAAAHIDAALQAQLAQVYSFDGPGVDEATLLSEGYARVSPLVQSYIPQSSVVGMLLCYHPVYVVVRSHAIGLWQHDALTWQITGGTFETLEGLDLSTRMADEALRQWIDRLTLEDRRFLTDTTFRVIATLDGDTIDPLVQDLPGSTVKLYSAFRRLEPDTRAQARRLLADLFTSGASEAVRMLLSVTFRRSAAGEPTAPATPLAESVRKRQAEIAGKLEGDAALPSPQP